MNQLLSSFGSIDPSPLFIVLLVWSTIWKGFALWRAGTLKQKWWFVAMLVINSFGILEIIYLFFITGKEKDSHIETPTFDDSK